MMEGQPQIIKVIIIGKNYYSDFIRSGVQGSGFKQTLPSLFVSFASLLQAVFQWLCLALYERYEYYHRRIGDTDMKTFKYIGLAGFTLLTVSSLLVAKSAIAVEKAKYAVLEKEDDFEIRQYDPQIVAETFVAGNLEEAGNEGFRRLYAYISGDNKKKQSISMTAPVGQETGSEKIAMTAPVSQEKKDTAMANYVSHAGGIYPGNASGTQSTSALN